MPSDRLLTEVERQQKYLDELPPDFDFPLFNSRRALESQRNNGYRTTAAAAREIVDNAIEVGASWVHVVIERTRDDGAVGQVRSIAFIDNGPGMLPMMARFALSWGGGTHFDDPAFIGKFGFGLPNASINQTRRVEVYTRTDPSQPFTFAWLDVDEFVANGTQRIPEPTQAALPKFVQRHLDQNKLKLETGTVVVWISPDRLSHRKPTRLKEELVDDFGVTYRYLLARKARPVEICVEGVRVEPVDPLFIMPEGRYYLPPSQGGAQPMEHEHLHVKYVLDKKAQEYHLYRAEDPKLTTDAQVIAEGSMHVRVVRFPVGFAAGKREPTTYDDADKRLEYRKSRRGISFVRADREIDTVDVFPKSERARASGLGVWPLLQSYAYHWGAEIKFEPDLDEVFGITNDKQSVRPIEDLWRVLHEADIDAALRRENNWQTKQREEQTPKLEASATPSAAERAAADADAATGARSPHVPEHSLPLVKKALEQEAAKRSEATGKPAEIEANQLVEEAKRRPYRIDYYESEDGPFFKPEWVGAQITVLINKRHPFFQVLYGDLARLGGGKRAKEAVDLLLLALARGELTAETAEMQSWYETQRKRSWSPFLEVAMNSLKQRMPIIEEEIADNGNE